MNFFNSPPIYKTPNKEKKLPRLPYGNLSTFYSLPTIMSSPAVFKKMTPQEWREKRAIKLKEESLKIETKISEKLNPIYTKSQKCKIKLNKQKVKIGVVITTHGFNGVFVKQALECYIRELPDNYFIVLYINESKDKIILDLMNQYNNNEAFKGKIQVIYIKDQKSNGGLTGTWNQGIDLCFENNCEIIVLSNDDILFDSCVNNILWSCYKSKDEMKYFGPLSNNPGPKNLLINKCQYGLLPLEKINKKASYKSKICNLNGFFMVFSKKVLLNNKFDNNFYFDPKYPFGGNETEWFERFKKKSGKPIIVSETFIYHYKLATWRKDHKKNNKCIYSVNTGNYDGYNIKLNESDIDTFYFTDNFKIIYLSIDKGLIPFYVDTTGKEAKLAQRLIKANPPEYLPHNYQTSLYVDGNWGVRNHDKVKYLFNLLKINDVDVVCFKHPERILVINEAKKIIELKLETFDNVNKIVNEMKENNFKDNIGLTETNVLLRNHKKIINFNKDWCRCINICRRDQISFDYLLYKNKVKFIRGTNREKNEMMRKFPGHVNCSTRTVS